MSKKPQTIVDMLRHGECVGGHIFRGSGTDVPLTSQGYHQMTEAVAVGEWDVIISSPLMRCQFFAQQLADTLSIPYEVNQNLREVHFGDWEGQLIADMWKKSPEILSQYFQNPENYTPEGGEAISVVKQRLATMWAETLSAHQGQKVLLIQHGGTIRLLLTLLLKLPIAAMNQFDVPYANLTRFKVFHQDDGDFPVLVSHNHQGK